MEYLAIAAIGFIAFGPGNRGNIHTLINQVARKKFIMIGNGQNKKSLAYV